MAVDLTAYRFEHQFQQGNLLGLLTEDNLTHHRFDVSVGQRYLDGETVSQLLQSRGSGEGALASGYEQDLALEPGGDTLDDVLDMRSLGVVVAYVLLHLVQHDEGERESSLGCRLESQDVIHGVEHLLVSDVLDRQGGTARSGRSRTSRTEAPRVGSRPRSVLAITGDT